MKTINLSLSGLKLLQPKVWHDERGFFCECYRETLYKELGDFVQTNHSYSKKGVLRGMHFQKNHTQAKLVTVLEGKIFDVALDMRRDSPTFGKWEGVYLDSEKHEQLFIPPGFAHGFCVVSEGAHVLYKVSTIYDPETEKGFAYNDLDIPWPVPNPILSKKDQEAPRFSEVV